jgi:hypothetical protein
MGISIECSFALVVAPAPMARLAKIKAPPAQSPACFGLGQQTLSQTFRWVLAKAIG